MFRLFGEKKEEPQVKVLAREKTRYNDIYVIQNGEHRELWFKGEGEYFLQSRVDTQGENPLALVYSRMMMVSLLFSPEPERMLMVGLGGAAVRETMIKNVRVSRSIIIWRPTRCQRGAGPSVQ